MIKAGKIIVSGFRGARYPLTIDLEKSCKSIAIFGENAGGKSTITDAIEWFFRDRVRHLWREECKEDALRNVQLNDSDDAIVGLEFSDNGLTCQKKLNKSLKVSQTNTSIEFQNFIAKATDERIVLRPEALIYFI